MHTWTQWRNKLTKISRASSLEFTWEDIILESALRNPLPLIDIQLSRSLARGAKFDLLCREFMFFEENLSFPLPNLESYHLRGIPCKVTKSRLNHGSWSATKNKLATGLWLVFIA